MKPRLVDLHTHTNASDGSDSPAELVRKAAKAGLAAVAVTDHDTVSGLDEAVAEGFSVGIPVIRGCELSCTGPYGEVHILGLWLPEHCDALERKFMELRERRLRRNRRMIDTLCRLGVPVTESEVEGYAVGESVGRPHIAKAMLGRGYVGSIKEAFDRYIGRDGVGFVPMEPFPPEEAVRLLAGVGATAVLAHPMLIRCPAAWRETLAKELTAVGLGALEAYHSEHSQSDERYLTGLAHRCGIGITGGSDYHGEAKPNISLGSGRGSLRVTETVFGLLCARRRASGLPM